MGVFRSEPMRHGTLVLPQEGAKDFITAIGSKVQVQIQDMNGNSLSRAYRRQLQRLEELERMLRYLVQQIESIAEVRLCDLATDLDRAADAAAAAVVAAAAASADAPDVEATGGVASVAPDAAVATKPQVYMLDRVEDMLNKVYGQFLRFAQNNKDLQREKSAAEEELEIVSFAASQLRSSLQSPWHVDPGLAADPAAAAPAGSSCCSSSSTPTLTRQQQMQQVNTTRAVTADSHARSSSARRRRPAHQPSSSSSSSSSSSWQSELQQSEHHQGFPQSASKHLLAPGLYSLEIGELSSLVFSAVAGIMLAKDQERFARAIFRTTRGNAFTHFKRIDEEEVASHPNATEPKSLFVTYFQGAATGSAFMEKVKCVCSAMGARTYTWPRSGEEAQQRQQQLQQLLQDKAAAAAAYEEYFLNEVGVFLEPVPAVNMPLIASAAAAAAAAAAAEGDLHAAATAAAAAAAGIRRRPLITELQRFVLREKAVYTALNLFALSDATLRADCWFQEAQEGTLRQTLAKVAAEKNTSAFLLVHAESRIGDAEGGGGGGGSSGGFLPPTVFKTTCFMAPFQSLVDTYGIARYREANPAFFAAAIFPFLFGVMFGDVGHGLLLLVAAAALFVFKRKETAVSDEMVAMLLNARYMILLMALHSIFAGFMYNEIFSMGLNVFGSRWEKVAVHADGSTPSIVPSMEGPYPFGVDPKWRGASNELLFLNSLKMKLAILIGFSHMTVGLFLGLSNAVYFRDWPSVILSAVLRAVLLACIPLMFLGKPLFTLYVHRKKRPPSGFEQLDSSEPSCIQLQQLQEQQYRRQQYASLLPLAGSAVGVGTGSRDREAEVPGHASTHDDGEGLSELWLHTLIESIEFILGTISNTASYLRLWALSLAHQQLSIVFFEKTVGAAFEPGQSVPQMAFKLIVLFPLFFCVTIFVLIAMEALECFLHALRLQWVEFQNKFYKGDGVAFLPLDLNALPEDSKS
ncbi:V-type proton ATPase subunit a1 [Cyclospora cayetanensis]|uniref:V-type proton ATPase subunit a n=1 Tax=Cyclospora cayetanensis TaxID=88456 RepID=A0A6P6S496_9EIME|nr:V-type proton ATPase subunit a1 [Cyclospora cayetanensis]